MNQTIARALSALTFAAALAGCASKAPAPALYDFGPLTPAAAAAGAGAPKALVVADATGPAWLDNQRMYYRLLYADARQARPYAHHHWSATPLQLLSQRFKSRIAESGVKVLSSADAAAAADAALLRIDIDDFSHNFDSQSHSSGQLSLRATLLRGHRLLDQRSFSRNVAADSADAAGGAGALAAATDALAAELIAWLAVQPQPQQ